MQTTVIGQKKNSSMQEMGETREPMARDCWEKAQELGASYGKSLKRDFWVLYAAKPHVSIPRCAVVGWHISAVRPDAPVLGMLVFKWDHAKQALEVDEKLSMPYDVPLEDEEMSKSDRDVIPTLGKAAQTHGVPIVG